MTVDTLKNEAEPGVITLGLEEGGTLSFHTFYLSGAGETAEFWQPGRELSPEEEEALNFAALCWRIEKKALALITRAEQNTRGLGCKLERRGYDRKGVQVVLSKLMGLGLVDDERYGEMWLRSRLSRRGGKIPSPRSLRASLLNRGLDREAVEGALSQVLDPPTEETLLRQFLDQNHAGPEGPDGSEGPGGASGRGDSSWRNRLKFEGFSSDIVHLFFSD
jgi:regulatory protein